MTFARVPETEVIMEKTDSVSAFFDAGRRGGPLSPIYEFSCRTFSQLLPANGVVLDIGCGPARFLTRFLQYRPDLKGIGTDLSQRMLATAATLAEACGVASRINFVLRDFTSVDKSVSGRIDGIVCMSALHHCPDFDSLVAALSMIKRLSDRHSCAIWLFDLVRPESIELCELIPRTHEVSVGELLPMAFKLDWVNSLKAGWTFDEFLAALKITGLALQSTTANYSQLHWCGSLLADRNWQAGEQIFDHTDANKAERLASALGFESPVAASTAAPKQKMRKPWNTF